MTEAIIGHKVVVLVILLFLTASTELPLRFISITYVFALESKVCIRLHRLCQYCIVFALHAQINRSNTSVRNDHLIERLRISCWVAKR